MIYYIYHILNKKIGVTTNLNNRVTKQQGYKDYEVLDSTTSISKASELEIYYQNKFRYRKDQSSYKQLILNKMNKKVSSTEATTTFYTPKKDIKSFVEKLLDLKYKWSNDAGKSYEINEKNYQWVIDNAVVSQFNSENCFIYNKAFEEFNNKLLEEKSANLYDLIRDWAKSRGIYDKGDSKTQYIKLMEESGELAQSLLRKDKPEIKDAIGDMVVVLTNLAHLENMKIEDCVKSAYDVIVKRRGKMINGTFVKQL